MAWWSKETKTYKANINRYSNPLSSPPGQSSKTIPTNSHRSSTASPVAIHLTGNLSRIAIVWWIRKECSRSSAIDMKRAETSTWSSTSTRWKCSSTSITRWRQVSQRGNIWQESHRDPSTSMTVENLKRSLSRAQTQLMWRRIRIPATSFLKGANYRKSLNLKCRSQKKQRWLARHRKLVLWWARW